jgi:hypothetical protein
MDDARPPERSGAKGSPRATALGGRRGEAARLVIWTTRAAGAPAGAEWGEGVPASDGAGGSGGAKPPGYSEENRWER